MFLHATIVPPRAVLEAIANAVQSAEPALVAPPSQPLARRGAIRRLTGRTVRVAEPPAELASGFELIPADQLNLPIAGFGNVTAGDATKVASALGDEAPNWATPTVYFAGAAVQEFPAHRALALTLEGEVAELMSLARAVTQCVQRRGFRFDRRKFLPLLSVAIIREDTSSAQVKSFLNALESFRGEPWSVAHVSLMKHSFGGASPDHMEYQRIPVGPH